jgi:hypothetical protein
VNRVSNVGASFVNGFVCLRMRRLHHIAIRVFTYIHGLLWRLMLASASALLFARIVSALSRRGLARQCAGRPKGLSRYFK